MNHFSYILKLNTLSDSLTDEIYHLQKECEQQKHEEFYMYLDEDGSLYSDIKCFYLFYTEQVLAGFLSFFIEDDTSVCISGCVLPKYRGRHIFTRLYQSALNELSVYPELVKGIEFHLPDTPAGLSIPAVRFLNKNGLIMQRQEFLMMYDLTQPDKYNCPDNIYTEYDENDNEFTIWLNDTYIGGCFIYYTEDSTDSTPDYVTIYDYEILPKYRGKCYGKTGLLSILSDLRESGFRHAILHVSGQNKIAHSMYISCGFTVQSGFSVFSAEC